MTDRPVEPTPGPEATDLPEGEPTAAPSPGGSGFGDAAGEMANETEVEEQVAGDAVAGDDPGTAEERPGGGDDVDTEEDERRSP